MHDKLPFNGLHDKLPFNGLHDKLPFNTTVKSNALMSQTMLKYNQTLEEDIDKQLGQKRRHHHIV